MVASFLLGLLLMLAGQFCLTIFGWLRGSTFTASGMRIYWDDARVRDLEFVLRLALGGALAAFAVPAVPETSAVLYMVGVAAGFLLRSISDLPVILMERWGIRPSVRSKPHQPPTPGSTRPDGRRGRDR